MKTCTRCGKRLPHQDRRLFSAWTRSYYCIDIDACARRAKRKRRAPEGALAR